MLVRISRAQTRSRERSCGSLKRLCEEASSREAIQDATRAAAAFTRPSTHGTEAELTSKTVRFTVSANGALPPPERDNRWSGELGPVFAPLRVRPSGSLLNATKCRAGPVFPSGPFCLPLTRGWAGNRQLRRGGRQADYFCFPGVTRKLR